MNLTVANIAVRQDSEGRICLNDLHKAAIATGLNQRTKEPGKFFANQQTTELVAELTDTQNSGIAPVNTVKGGPHQGTFACRDLAYAYAMWISPAFFLKVVKVYDAVVNNLAARQPSEMQTAAHYESEHARLLAELERLEVTPICMMPADFRELKKPYFLIGDHPVRVVDFVAMTESHGVPRKEVENLLGINNTNMRQQAFRARGGAK